ncbi:MAG: spore coat protein [Caulobacteraceae bacterium]
MNNKATLSEQDILNDLLTMEKQIASSYNTGITEASCKNLRQTLTDSLTDTHTIQYNLFDTMKKQGWYQTKDAPDQDVTSTKDKYNQLRSQL